MSCTPILFPAAFLDNSFVILSEWQFQASKLTIKMRQRKLAVASFLCMTVLEWQRNLLDVSSDDSDTDDDQDFMAFGDGSRFLTKKAWLLLSS